MAHLQRILNIYEKGNGALIVWRMKVVTEEGAPVAEAEHGIFCVGAGCFGGDPGPRAETLDPPAGVPPSFTTSYYIPENQAALYRLNGDPTRYTLTPILPEWEVFRGPLLHGLCTYGYAPRAILHSACDRDTARFKEFKARFSGVVYPGDTLVTEGAAILCQ